MVKLGQLPAPLKATFSFIVMQLVATVLTIILSGILVSYIPIPDDIYNDYTYSIYYANYLIVQMSSATLPISIGISLISVLGLIALMAPLSNNNVSFRLIIAFVVLELVAAIGSAVLGYTYQSSYFIHDCSTMATQCPKCNWNPDDASCWCYLNRSNYEKYCLLKGPSYTIIGPVLITNAFLAVAAIICGSISAKIFKQRPTVVKS